MITKELIDYIKVEISKGRNKEEITADLLRHDWYNVDIEEAFEEVNKNTTIPAVSPSSTIAGLTRPIMVFPTFIEMLKKSFSLLYDKFWKLLCISSIPIIFSIATIFLTNISLAFSVILVLPQIIFFIWSFIAFVVILDDKSNGISVLEAFSKTKNKIFPVWWGYVIFSFCVFGGVVFLFFPGIIIATLLSLFVFVIVLEDSGGVNSLMKSREYIRGYAWKVFFNLGIIFLVFNIIPNLFFYKMLDFFSDDRGIIIFILIISAIISIILGLFILINMYVIYDSLRSLKSDMVFEPTKSRKIKYVLLSIFGLIFMIASMLVIPLYLSKQTIKDKQYENSEPQENYYEPVPQLPSNNLLEEIPYIDDIYGFSIKSPKGWSIHRVSENELSLKSPNSLIYMNISVLETHGYSLDKVVETTESSLKEFPDYEIESKGYVNINNKNGVIFKYNYFHLEQNITLKEISLIITEGDYSYLITASGPIDYFNQEESGILSSLYSFSL